MTSFIQMAAMRGLTSTERAHYASLAYHAGTTLAVGQVVRRLCDDAGNVEALEADVEGLERNVSELESERDDLREQLENETMLSGIAAHGEGEGNPYCCRMCGWDGKGFQQSLRLQG